MGEVVLETLWRFRGAAEEASATAANTTSTPGAEDEKKPTVAWSEKSCSTGAGTGALFVYEEELTLKVLLLRLLNAENRKILFGEAGKNGSPPRLLRVLSVSDVWLLLIGNDLGAGEQDPDAVPCDGGE